MPRSGKVPKGAKPKKSKKVMPTGGFWPFGKKKAVVRGNGMKPVKGAYIKKTVVAPY